MGLRMRFYVERCPGGGYLVKMRGSDAPISRHDTEEEAEGRRDAYARGAVARDTERAAQPTAPPGVDFPRAEGGTSES
jgi:hypothetical protein